LIFDFFLKKIQNLPRVKLSLCHVVVTEWCVMWQRQWHVSLICQVSFLLSQFGPFSNLKSNLISIQMYTNIFIKV